MDADDSFERLLLCKRPRGKKEPEYEIYKTMTRAAIHKLNGEIKKAEKNGDWAESKKLRNMKSSTESRLIKRAGYERTKAQLAAETQFNSQILEILRKELDPDTFRSIDEKITEAALQLGIRMTTNEESSSI